MNLIFRMLWVLLRSLSAQRLPVGVAANRLRLVTLPNDLDINFHMNNGRYLTICDLNRVDLFIRTGLLRVMFKEGWIPIVSEHTMSYKRPLKLFQTYESILELTHWDERAFYMKHRFMSGDKLVAEGTSVGVIRARGGVIPPEQVLERVRQEVGAQPLPPEGAA